MLQSVIERYKRLRTNSLLAHTYSATYAFVGMGNHSMANLYPVLSYLHIPLRYICVRNEEKARLVQQAYPHTTVTTRLDDVLGDEAVNAVFVAASPESHFELSKSVLQSQKALFVEKPPCRTADQLHELLQMGGQVSLVGLQKRYAPAVQMLRRRLRHDTVRNYTLRYQTGAYPEGNALLDLYIHPLDLVTWLFGKAEILALQTVCDDSYILMLKHADAVGMLELSTAYSWTTARDTLDICTRRGNYRLTNAQQLTFVPTPQTVFGVPTEKVRRQVPTVQHLFSPNSFSPIVSENQVYTAGFFSEIRTFAELVEGRKAENLTPLSSLVDTYDLIRECETAQR